MKKVELENLNSLLKGEVKAYAETNMTEVLMRIRTYKNVYEILSIENEYHKVINETYISCLNIDFYKREKLISIIEILENYKINISMNILIDGLENFTTYLSELVWNLNIDIKDIKKIEKSLDEI